MSAPKVPAYRHHKAVGQAYVNVRGRQIYLGKFGSPESHEAYSRFVAEFLASPVAAPISGGLAVVELASRYWDFAEQYYRKDGEPTAHLGHVRTAIRELDALYGSLPAAQFSALKLKAMQQHFVAKGHARSYINDLVGVIRRMFKWATAEELVPTTVCESLRAVPGLKKGRTAAREPAPILPVDDAIVAQTLPFLPKVVADMVRFQRLTGCRPTEVCILRPCDVDRSSDVWLYMPKRHKGEHHDKRRVIFIGPQAQEVLRPYLLREPSSYCFVPAESERKRNAERRESRNTPAWPSHAKRRRGSVFGGACYTKDSYNRAVRRACDRADREAHERDPAIERDIRVFPAWHPSRLRHTAATEARKQFNLEAAQVLLGHAHADVTQIYAEANLGRGVEVARRIG